MAQGPRLRKGARARGLNNAVEIMSIEIALMMITFGLCVYAALTDLRRLEIDNWVSIAIIALFIPFTVMTGGGWVGHIVVMLVVLLVGFLLHATNIMGGGDIKLLTALSLWAGPEYLPALMLVTSLAGAGIAMATLALQKPSVLSQRIVPQHTGLAWIDEARAGGSNVAYGVAIAIGAACMFYQMGV